MFMKGLEQRRSHIELGAQVNRVQPLADWNQKGQHHGCIQLQERQRQERQGDGTGRKNCSRQDWCAQELPCWAFVFVSLWLWASVSLSCFDLSCHLTKVHSHCKPNTQILPSVLTTEPTPSPPEDWRRVLPLSPSNAAFLPRLALAKCFPGGTVILPPAFTVGFQSFMNNSSFQNVLISTFSISSE